MTLRGYVPEVDAVERSLVLVDSTAPEPVRRMLADLFAEQPISVESGSLPDQAGETVVLVEDGSVVASSPLAALQESILFVNSDLFITGTRSIEEIEVPAVLTELKDVPFRVRGYPDSNAEKLLLILLSRFVEGRALDADAGRLRASFQQLSRIEDEVGTRKVYERLADSGVDTHVYGVPDWIPSRELDLVTHAGRGSNFRNTWFVVFEPDGSGVEPFGLLAYEIESRVWRGFYTDDPDRLAAIGEEISTRM